MKRTEMREHIFKIIFSLEFDVDDDRMDFEGCANQYIDQYEEDMDIAVNHETREYIVNKALAVRDNITDIDIQINTHADRWDTKRMAKVEVSILRLAVYEILLDKDIPNAVAINEAVNLAKKFGSDQSYTFINGLLAELV